MVDYVRQASFDDGDLVEAPDFEAEFNAIVTAVNSKAEADGNPTDNLVSQFVFEKDDRTLHEVSKAGGDGNNGEPAIPLCNETLQVGLNAATVGGLSSAEISGAAFPAGFRMLVGNSLEWITNELPGWSKVAVNTLSNRDPVIMVGDGHLDGSDGTSADPLYGLAPDVNTKDGILPTTLNSSYRWGLSDLGGFEDFVNGGTDTVTQLGSQVPQHTHPETVPIQGNVDSGTTSVPTANNGATSDTTGVNSGPTQWDHDHDLESGSINFRWRPPHIYMLLIEKD